MQTENRHFCPVSDVSEAQQSQPPMGQESDPQTVGGVSSGTCMLENTVKILGFQALLQGRYAAVGGWLSHWNWAPVIVLWLK